MRGVAAGLGDCPTMPTGTGGGALWLLGSRALVTDLGPGQGVLWGALAVYLSAMALDCCVLRGHSLGTKPSPWIWQPWQEAFGTRVSSKQTHPPGQLPAEAATHAWWPGQHPQWGEDSRVPTRTPVREAPGPPRPLLGDRGPPRDSRLILCVRSSHYSSVTDSWG